MKDLQYGTLFDILQKIYVYRNVIFTLLRLKAANLLIDSRFFLLSLFEYSVKKAFQQNKIVEQVDLVKKNLFLTAF